MKDTIYSTILPDPSPRYRRRLKSSALSAAALASAARNVPVYVYCDTLGWHCRLRRPQCLAEQVSATFDGHCYSVVREMINRHLEPMPVRRELWRDEYDR